MQRICVTCGKTFTASGRNNTCSIECRKERTRKKKSEYAHKPKADFELTRCAECGNFFMPVHGSQKFCKKTCCNKYNKRNQRERLSPKTCDRCGNDFIGRQNEHFCSRQCRYLSRVEKMQAYRREHPERFRGKRKESVMEQAIIINLSEKDMADLKLREDRSAYRKALWHYNHLTEKEMPFRF